MVKRALKQIKTNKATGPDGIPALVLYTCADELALPILLLTRRLLNECVWPWKIHNIQGIFKRKFFPTLKTIAEFI